MKADVKKLKNSEVEVTISVPYETYQKWEKKALEEISKQVKIDGFRAGNIPEDILREKVDAQAITAATLDYVLPQTYSQAVKEHDLQVVAQPQVDIKKTPEKEGDEFVYVATVAVLPEVKLGDYKKIKVARKEEKVDAKKVDETIKMIMDRYAEWKDVDRKAKDGDRVEIDFSGHEPDGAEIPNTASKNHPLVLGSKAMVPGFEDAIVGMSKDDEKEFDVTFPKDYHAEPMKGKKVKFKLKLNRLEEKLDQKLDDAFVQKLMGEKATVDEFKQRVEDDLKAEMEQRARAEHDNAVVSEIIKITKVELPDALIDQELKLMMEEQKQKIAQQGLSWEQYLAHVKKTEDDFMKENHKGAEERIKARLGVQHIIKDAKIETSDEEVDKRIEELIAGYPAEQHAPAREHFAKDEVRRNLKHNMSADKLIEMLTK